MSETGDTDTLVSRSDIARLAGVQRPAVTNWERRYDDFPAPCGTASGQDRFRASAVMAWLDRRVVPAHARRAGERPGTTYGDRFRAGSGASGRRTPEAEPSLVRVVRELSRSGTQACGGRMSVPEYLRVVMALVYLRVERPDRWAELVAGARRGERPDGLPHIESMLGSGFDERGALEAYGLVHGAVRAIEEAGEVTRAEGAQAYTVLLAALGNAADRASGEIHTPQSVVSALVELLLPGATPTDRLHDPFCRAGEFLAAAVDAMTAGREGLGVRAVVGGAAGGSDLMRRLASMNVELHGGSADLRLDEPWPEPGPRGRYDYVLTNPPFNTRLPDYTGEPAHWRYGPPPSGNANFDWLQYVADSLAEGGRAAVLMPAIAATSSNPKERHIRTRMVDAGVVDALISLPEQMFATTGVPVTAWILTKPFEAGRDGRAHDDVLFIDGTGLGTMVSRTQRALSDEDRERVVETYRARATVKGFSRVVPREEIRQRRYDLGPFHYLTQGVPGFPGRDVSARGLRDSVDRMRVLDGRARDADEHVNALLRGYGL